MTICLIGPVSLPYSRSSPAAGNRKSRPIAAFSLERVDRPVPIACTSLAGHPCISWKTAIVGSAAAADMIGIVASEEKWAAVVAGLHFLGANKWDIKGLMRSALSAPR